MTHPKRGLHTVPKNFPELLENQAASLPWPGRVPVMARCVPATSWTWPAHCIPKTAQNRQKIRLHPYRGHETSQTWPALRVLKIAKKCQKSGCIPIEARMHPGHGLYAMPTNCLQIPENQDASPLRSGRAPDVAYTPCPKKSQKCLEIRLHPCSSPDASRKLPAHRKLPRNAWKPDCIPAVAQTHPEHCLHTVFQKQPKNTSKSGCVPAASWTCLARRVPETTQNCLKIRLCPYCGHDPSRTWPGHRVPENAKKCLKIGLLPTTGRTRPRYGQHTMLTNCIQMPENQVTFLPQSGRVPYMAFRSWPAHRVLETAKRCLKIKLRP
ncbi:Hypothetical predicted protein [Olea europaea subsp. europaea]|uniref:Uncharacterized protein n=1 Tax=Olea europaea subsp. europaea TaxID=158383 RepID=A0A8S0TY73_OLEEU|nr:Hypothetical predicted protein [Olea europaea subsp. europaea]